jgi:hypothetical protein
LIVAIDSSKNYTGVAFFEDGQLVESYLINTNGRKKFPELKDIVGEIKAFFDDRDLSGVKIYLEASLEGMQGPTQNRKTLVSLARHNGAVEALFRFCYGCEVEMVPPRVPRRRFGLKKSAEKDIKTTVLEYVCRETGFTYELTAYGNPKPGSYDQADAILIGMWAAST